MPSLPEILLIEDSADDRALFDRAVAASGMEVRVTHVSSAPEAVMRLNRLGHYAGTDLPSIIVLDLSLPGLQGATLLQVVRNAYGPREVPVVILTGSDSAADQESCEPWDISDYVVKPHAHSELVAFVRSLARFLPSGKRQATTVIVRNNSKTGA